MRSINQLQEQTQNLKAQEKEHRRSALIQDLRTQQREQDLLIDVLKQTLQEKAAEFQDSRALVNDFVLKKTAGGPMRFRPKTREELENELQALGQNFHRTVEKLKQESQRNAAPKEEKPHDSDHEDEDEKTEEKDVNNYNDQIVRKKHKIALLREQLERQQADNVELVQEKEELAEKYLQVQEETQFLRDITIEDAGAKDEERLQQLELIQTLRSRELELQDELERQQKKWATDRDTVHQRLRVLEKEKKIAEEEVERGATELTSLQKKNDALQQEILELKVAVQEEQDQKIVLSSRVKVEFST
ncbi:uncharacterized protein PITG_05402 [Phytophthora infestans T30-4]|uniref:Uncharacterized protein n=1 Tax=Phytophthora infestans (strain T30-4) TaxID=403677 RepID=D0N2Q8_PHYIT|nr:uncharacterized protein PITG_05402 [Phytophthora infestans T30-4]EEY69200.1 conserved hypothetical protein [Phytophthora infestans T30-4]|eukprot:XP_002999054.1 conserved hypothetical protein [Phytophthora infestans T30-4]